MNGVDIPHYCWHPKLAIDGSCRLCQVEVEGAPKLQIACNTPVRDGMVIDVDSEKVREARKTGLELLLSDHAGDCIAPCSARCPAGLDIPGFLYPLAAGSPEEAIEVLWRRLPLAGALGRVCPRLCEQHCRRQHHDGKKRKLDGRRHVARHPSTGIGSHHARNAKQHDAPPIDQPRPSVR